MPDFNKVLTPGDVDGGLVNTVVEIPEGSRLKVEWDREHAAFTLDRVEPAIFAKPCNYGFIPQTLDEDGDELDTLIICPEPLATGVWLEAKVIGVMKFEDDGEVDDKVVVVPADNRDDDRINSLDDIPQLVQTARAPLHALQRPQEARQHQGARLGRRRRGQSHHQTVHRPLR